MAIKLHEGGYALLQEPSRKTVVQMKLTDSALRAIEVYHEKLGAQGGKPSIKFDGNQGVLQIPSGEARVQTFTFLLAANKSAAIDCLQQYRTREPTGRVAVLGEIGQKITINANDDSYSATKKRMEIAKELEKNISTKVIKQPSSSKIGKKKALHRSALLSHTSSFAQGRNTTAHVKSSHSFVRSSSPMTSAPARSASPSGGADLAGVRNKTKPVLSSLSSSGTNQSATDVPASRPLNERVLHIVAIKQITLQELMAKLKRGGSCPDKATLQAILQQLATTRPDRSGVVEYFLKTNLYNEVRADWPGYTEEERSALRRKQAEVVLRESRKRGVEPSTATSNSSSSQKPLQDETYSNPVRKKPRVSLYKKSNAASSQARSVSPLDSIMSQDKLMTTAAPNAGATESSNVLSTNNFAHKVSPKRPLSADGKTSKPSHSPNVSPLLNDSFTSSLTPSSTVIPIDSLDARADRSNRSNSKKRAKNDSLTKRLKKQNNKFSHSQSPEKADTTNYDTLDLVDDARESDGSRQQVAPVAMPKLENDEFIRKYTSIKRAEKRDQYKSDFNAEYEEYRKLHKKVAAHSKRFADWRGELNKQAKHTEAYKRIAKQVYKEYQALKQDKEFIKERNRMQYLHRKLKHIKDLVLEFDCKQNVTSRDFQRLVLV